MEPTPSSSNAADDFHRRPTNHDDVFPLLSLPSGVEVALLSVLSAGKGGLKNVLTLRSVCSTTRSWVDNLPKSDADLVFSKAQVTMHSDLHSLRAFNSSSPPFGVTTLRLNIGRMGDIDEYSREEEVAWESFLCLWARNLESLEVHSGWELYFHRHVTTLLDSVNLKKIAVMDSHVHPHTSPITWPSSFETVSELRLTSFSFRDADSERSQLYSLLRNNHNLRVLAIGAEDAGDLEKLAELIDSKRVCPHFQLNLTLDVDTEGVSRLTQSILGSRSQFRLRFLEWETVRRSRLVHPGSLSLLAMVEVIDFWYSTVEDFSLRDFPRLKEVGWVGVKEAASAAQLVFPPSLEKVSLSRGFPNCQNLPDTLKHLKLEKYEADENQFVSAINTLGARCAELERLLVCWECPEERQPTLDFGPPPQGFQKLRELRIRGKLIKKHVDSYRAAILGAFNWRKLQLHSLKVSLTDFHFRDLPLVDEGVLRGLIEGPSGKSLLKVDIPDGGVASEGALQMLRNLRVMVAENVQMRLRSEGPGAWQRHFQSILFW